MRALFLGLGLPLLLLAAFACGGQPQEATPDQNPDTVVERTLAAMAALDSYRLEMDFGPGGPPILIEFAAPASYHFRWIALRATDEQESLAGVFETIIAGDRAYTRECEDIGRGCGDWQEGPRPPVPIAGPSPSFLPQWPLVALEMAQTPQLLGSEELDGISLLHLRASVNQIRAILENERRVFTAAGITSFGEECELAPGGQEQCRQLSFEEALEQQEPALSFYDRNPSSIEAWLSPDDFLMHRIALAIPSDEPGAEETSVLLRYSRFNQVDIQPPR